jgi:hypothetical protein
MSVLQSGRWNPQRQLSGSLCERVLPASFSRSPHSQTDIRTSAPHQTPGVRCVNCVALSATRRHVGLPNAVGRRLQREITEVNGAHDITADHQQRVARGRARARARPGGRNTAGPRRSTAWRVPSPHLHREPGGARGGCVSRRPGERRTGLTCFFRLLPDHDGPPLDQLTLSLRCGARPRPPRTVRAGDRRSRPAQRVKPVQT